nr:hypothetical protein [Lachnospiraceae bacterium]
MLCFSEAVYRQIATFAAPCRDGQLETDFRLEAIDADVFFVRLFRDKGTEIEVDYKERMIELIRMTSVVGFVAANDMTHVLEVIRMESLELWIPLIATAVAYIVLTVVMCKLLDVFATKCFTLCEMQVWCKVMDE